METNNRRGDDDPRLNRREFVGGATLCGVAALAAAGSAAHPPRAAAATTAPSAPSKVAAFELDELTIADLLGYPFHVTWRFLKLFHYMFLRRSKMSQAECYSDCQNLFHFNIYHMSVPKIIFIF